MEKYNQKSHAIDYRIIGEEMQCVEIELDPQETAIAESGSFMKFQELNFFINKVFVTLKKLGKKQGHIAD